MNLLRKKRADTDDIESVASSTSSSHVEGFLAKMSPTERQLLVSHRGFHFPDDNPQRPMENTLKAFLTSWNSGVENCECDVRCDKDGRLVVCHDSSFSRVAGSEYDRLKDMHTSALKEIILKDGSPILLLEEIMDEMLQLSQNKRLVIECKEHDAQKFYEAFLRIALDEKYLPLFQTGQIPVVMSFDLGTIRMTRKVRAAFKEKFPEVAFPSLMLLTVKEGTKQKLKGSKLDVSWDMADHTSLELLKTDLLEGLDGIYMEYSVEMVTNKKYQNLLALLKKEFRLGVFFTKEGDNESYDKLQGLQATGIDFINTDFPALEQYFI